MLALLVAVAAVAALAAREASHRREIARLNEQLAAARIWSSQQEQLASMGAMVSDLAQELKGPLQGVLGNTELMLMSERGADETEELRDIQENATRAVGLVRNLLAFTDTANLRRNWTDVNALVSRAADSCRSEISADRFGVELALSSRLPLIYADGRQLEKVFANFIGRAARSQHGRPDAARVNVRVSTGRSQPADRLVIDVDEEGALLSRAQESFGDGGLAACTQIIEAHGGGVTIKDRPRGLHMHVELPIMAEAAQEQE